MPNPFIHLREPDECEEESEDEEVPSIIHVQVGADKKATMLWSDGSNIIADYYELGDKGFAIAVWLAASHEGHVYETEIPNVYISQDKSHLGADIKKRKSSVVECDDDSVAKQRASKAKAKTKSVYPVQPVPNFDEILKKLPVDAPKIIYNPPVRRLHKHVSHSSTVGKAGFLHQEGVRRNIRMRQSY